MYMNWNKVLEQDPNESFRNFVDNLAKKANMTKREIIQECVYKYGIEVLARAERGTEDTERIVCLPMKNEIYDKIKGPKSKYIEEALKDRFLFEDYVFGNGDETDEIVDQ